jgi:hypothetical protein
VQEICESKKPRLGERWNMMRSSSIDIPIALVVRDKALTLVLRVETSDPHLMFENRTIKSRGLISFTLGLGPFKHAAIMS